MHSRIIGTGSYLPEKVLTNRDLERMVDTSDEWIVTRTGIRERRVASDDQMASDLALEASRRALAAAGIAPRFHLAHSLLGEALIRQRRRPEAAAAFGRAHELYTGDPDLRRILRRLAPRVGGPTTVQPAQTG